MAEAKLFQVNCEAMPEQFKKNLRSKKLSRQLFRSDKWAIFFPNFLLKKLLREEISS